MSGIVGVFASIGEHLPILNKEKLAEPKPEGPISRFHYRGTAIMILSFCVLVTTTEWVSGTDSIINCLHNGPIPENVIENYCYIIGTFSVPKHYVDEVKDIGNRVSQTGVGPYEEDDEIEIKGYYQWVPFMLFLQGCMFYVPHLIFKVCEAGKIKLILTGLHQYIMDSDERSSKQEDLATYLVETRHTHRVWCFKILFAQCLYLVNVIGNMFLTDCFLGWEFYTYGVQALSFLEGTDDFRVDPMSRVFPRVTKCIFRKFGPSGTIQKHDAQCVLPINIINEKIYVFLWFWFGLLSALTILELMWTFCIVFLSSAKSIIIRRKLRLSPKHKTLKVDVNFLCRNMDFGDWKLLYHLLKNMDSLLFGEVLEHYSEILQKELDSEGKDDTLSLRSLMRDKDEKPDLPDDDDDEFLKLHDGNYLKAKEAGEVDSPKRTTDI